MAVKIEKNAEGIVRPEEVLRAIEREAAGGDLCGLMITNPNTLGVYEAHLPEIVKLVHDRGGLVYGDGANTNAIMGAARARATSAWTSSTSTCTRPSRPRTAAAAPAPARSASRSTSSRSSPRPSW